MPADRIESEIEVDAPVEVVWNVITSPEHISAWFTDETELDLRPDGEGRFTWIDKTGGRTHSENLRIERVEPPYFFAFRWNYPDGAEPDETNAPLVEFSLEPRGDGTRLVLVESGIQGLSRSEEEKDSYFREHTSGWATITERLRIYAADQRSTVAG
jgi:uncharacterized protein YndB with AHSA1/START domain